MKPTGKPMTRKRIERYGLLRRIRQRQEETRANVFAIAERKLLSAKQELDAIETEQKEVIHRAQDQADTLHEVPKINQYLQYERHLGRVAVQKSEHIGILTLDTDEKRRELQEAVKQRRIIDRLIEKSEQRLNERMKKREQLAMDEIATTRAAALRLAKTG